jgi:chromate transporter
VPAVAQRPGEDVDASAAPALAAPPTFAAAVRFWLKLGCISFGGPAGQIAIMHAELVDRRRWIDEPRFLRALNFCMVLPGPEAQQLATYLGHGMHGVRGGLAAGGLFVLPSFVLLVALSYVYVRYGTVPEVAGVVDGLGAAVVALIAAALVRIGGRTVRGPLAAAVAALAAVLILVGVPFPLVLVLGAAAGVAAARAPGRHAFAVPVHGQSEPAAGVRRPAVDRRRRRRRSLALALAGWIGPLAALVVAGGVYGDLAWFFSLAALVTFGGAYAVLPFVADAAVERFGWLTTEQMVAGLALGETTPGPLIMVNTFVGYVAGHNLGGGHLAGLAGAAVATLATFGPSFLFIFLGAPFIDRIPSRGAVAEALAGVTVVVVGAVAALGAFIGNHVFLGGDGVDLLGVALAIAAFFALWRLRAAVVGVIAACALAGLVRSLL